MGLFLHEEKEATFSVTIYSLVSGIQEGQKCEFAIYHCCDTCLFKPLMFFGISNLCIKPIQDFKTCSVI
jgi:hypothetical protein